MSKNITIEELKQIISEEAKALTSVKGIKDDKSDTWGGKGSANAGLKNVYGGKGSGKGGDPFGGEHCAFGLTSIRLSLTTPSDVFTLTQKSGK